MTMASWNAALDCVSALNASESTEFSTSALETVKEKGVGETHGALDGLALGTLLGVVLGELVGAVLGMLLGAVLGKLLGAADGALDG